MGSVAERIATRRKELKLSKRQLAQTIGVSHQAVCQWESGRSCPINGHLVALADCLDCSVRYLLEGKHGKHDDFELMLLNALIAAGIKLPKDHKPPDHFRRLYRAGKLSRKEIIKLMREEFINVRQLNEWTNQ